MGKFLTDREPRYFQRRTLPWVNLPVWCIICTVINLFMTLTAYAASFDCAKASTRAEHLICENPNIVRLDEEMSELYGEVFKKIPDEELFKKQQQKWIDARNRCEDISCLKRYYQERIAELQVANEFKSEESYVLLMSKNDELCSHMLQLFNRDLKKYGWNGDAYQDEHEEFRRIFWMDARYSYDQYGKAAYETVKGASFDFNNDGVQDFVIHDISSLSNARADLLFVFDSEMARRANDITSNDLLNAKNKLYMAGWGYKLSTPLAGKVGVFRVLKPFIFREISYLVMRPLFEGQPVMTGYAVIAKYKEGRFVAREPLGVMDDICYYQRNRAKSIQK